MGCEFPFNSLLEFPKIGNCYIRNMTDSLDPGAPLVPHWWYWCPIGAPLVPHWCPVIGAPLVPRYWCPIGAQLVHQAIASWCGTKTTVDAYIYIYIFLVCSTTHVPISPCFLDISLFLLVVSLPDWFKNLRSRFVSQFFTFLSKEHPSAGKVTWQLGEKPPDWNGRHRKTLGRASRFHQRKWMEIATKATLCPQP